MSRTRQGGFVITTEALLISTILVIGLFVGIVAVRDALFKLYAARQTTEFFVFDDTGEVLGRVEFFDEHEAPLIPFVDYDVDGDGDGTGDGNNYRALVGVRDDRFTTRQRVYYTDDACGSATFCILGPSEEDGDSTGIDDIVGTGSVSYLFALQEGPTYAVGAGDGGALKGRLYRQSAIACDNVDLQSRWTSQKVVAGTACEDIAPLNTGSGRFWLAVDVVDANGLNVLDPLIPPFATNLPMNPITDLTPVAPVGEGN